MFEHGHPSRRLCAGWSVHLAIPERLAVLRVTFVDDIDVLSFLRPADD